MKVGIIGLGLIGMSLAKALRAGGDDEVHGFDVDPQVRTEASGAQVLQVADDVLHVASVAKVLVLCVPVGASGALMQQLAPALRPGCIVTDVGSVKRRVIDAVRPHLPAGVHFVPGHPIAGAEKSGPGAAFAELFQGRRVIFTPEADTDPQALQQVAQLWQRCGAVTETMDPDRHDTVFALVSHLPHLIAYCIVGTAYDLEQVGRSEVIRYAASGFRDFTRLAASDPTMWRDICLNNAPAILNMLGRFTEDLLSLQRQIRDGDAPALFARFASGRDVRQRIIEAGVDTAAADFGRAKQTP